MGSPGTVAIIGCGVGSGWEGRKAGSRETSQQARPQFRLAHSVSTHYTMLILSHQIGPPLRGLTI